jgi:hypothetical protein
MLAGLVAASWALGLAFVAAVRRRSGFSRFDLFGDVHCADEEPSCGVLVGGGIVPMTVAGWW